MKKGHRQALAAEIRGRALRAVELENSLAEFRKGYVLKEKYGQLDNGKE